MTFEEADAYIAGVPKFTVKNKPENTKELMRRLQHPGEKKKIIHVAGTNGKGSVCAFLSSMLVAGGKKTGLFTSPHLVRLTERVQIDNRPVPDAVFAEAFTEVMEIVEDMQRDGFAHPAYFELLFAAAMLIFQKENVEYIVLETGLGGRLDATNTVERPILTVLTSISMDHMEILGDTVAKIASEKAGILKEGVPLVYDAGNEEANRVILARAKELHVPATGLLEDQIRILRSDEKSIDFTLHVGYYENRRVTAPYPAPYQTVNASLALLAMEKADPAHKIPVDIRIRAIADTRWQGRMETVLPGVIVDGAHNADGIRQFVKTLMRVPKERRVVLLFSAVAEKEYEQMIRTICETGKLSEVVVTQIDGSRVVPAEKLSALFRRFTDVPVTARADIREAFREAISKQKGGILFCVGSLYLVGEIKEILEERTND